MCGVGGYLYLSPITFLSHCQGDKRDKSHDHVMVRVALVLCVVSITLS